MVNFKKKKNEYSIKLNIFKFKKRNKLLFSSFFNLYKYLTLNSFLEFKLKNLSDFFLGKTTSIKTKIISWNIYCYTLWWIFNIFFCFFFIKDIYFFFLIKYYNIFIKIYKVFIKKKIFLKSSIIWFIIRIWSWTSSWTTRTSSLFI